MSRLAAYPFQLGKVIAAIRSVELSPDGKTLASGSRDKTIKLWNVASGKNIATLSAHSGFVESLARSPDGKTLASASEDKTIRLWDVAAIGNKKAPEH